ncbi:unnamed protein product [Ilex paraguariensis]|uniref:Uncharacterized protein n=1 Tax=Ilex paraguariensis TaxID=185542 RepID=A0ABC8SGS5_9AQUA
MQLTRFKCGGTSVGLSWAHVLGDAFSVAEFMDTWSKVAAGHQLAQPINLAQPVIKSPDSQSPPKIDQELISVKRVGPIGDHWITTNACKMETFSFHVSPSQLNDLHSNISGKKGSSGISPFDSLCAIIWQSVAKVRDGTEPKVVTIYRKDPNMQKYGIVSNSQVISSVMAGYSIRDADPMELAALIKNQAVDERKKIQEAMERDRGLSDFIMYGANLTFVNLEETDFYGFEMKGEKPIFVSYTIDGVGDEGLVLVQPGPINAGKDGSAGRIVTITVPENEVLELKSELETEWSIA